jgi:hypothetical protein
MAITSNDIRKMLINSDPEIQRLAQEHSRCERQLAEILQEPYRNLDDDLTQEIKLKKTKLLLKDQIEELVNRRQHEARQDEGRQQHQAQIR